MAIDYWSLVDVTGVRHPGLEIGFRAHRELMFHVFRAQHIIMLLVFRALETAYSDHL